MLGRLYAAETLRPIRVRWIIFALLVGFGFLGYMQRTGITVVSKGIMSDAGLTQVQIGWALTSFLLSYTILQLPGGVLGEWAGARRTFAVITPIAVVATIAIAVIPVALSGSTLFFALLGSCLLLGAAQSPIFPVASGVIEVWFPVGRWGTPQGLLTAGVQLGSAAAAPLTAWLVQTVGWELALIFPGVPALVLTGYWFWYARDNPAQHRSVSAVEFSELRLRHSPEGHLQVTFNDVLQVLRDRNILLLSISYLCMNYVFYLISFWCFLYLVEERHFSIVEGGWLASLPYVGAAVGGIVGGIACDRLCSTWGVRVGFRVIPLVALPIAGLLLFLAVNSRNGYEAVAALFFAFGSIELTEGPFSAAATTVGRQHTMAAVAVLNTGGNCGGIIATPIVAALSTHASWTVAFMTGSAFSLVSAFLWLFVDASQPLGALVRDPPEHG